MREQVINHIKQEDVDSWTRGDIITINAQTGSGKTYFVLNVLYYKAKAAGKKILLFVPRRHTLNQLQAILDEEQKGDIVLLQLYQKLEHTLNTLERGEELSDYQKNNRVNGKNLLYIVADESHYFFDDAMFNGSTDVSFAKVMNYSDKVITVFMSATSKILDNYLTNVLQKKIFPFAIPHDYSHIRNLYFFKKDSDLENLLEDWHILGVKALLFIQSPSKGIEIKKKYPDDTIFACSKSNPSSATYYKKAVDENEIEKVLKNEIFETQFFVATSCFDVGVNIKDSKLHNIVIDMKDEHSLIQCLGRKRIVDENDYVDVYIKLQTSQSLNTGIRKNRELLAPAEYLMSHTQYEFIKKYKKVAYDNLLIYDQVDEVDEKLYHKQVNQMMYHKLLAQIETNRTILNDYKCRGVFPQDNYGYAKFISSLFNRWDADRDMFFYEVLDNGMHENKRKLELLEKYLCENVRKTYPNRADREPLIQAVGLKSKRSDGTYGSRYVKSVDAINDFLRKMQLPYQITVKEIAASADGKNKHLRASWTIVEVL